MGVRTEGPWEIEDISEDLTLDEPESFSFATPERLTAVLRWRTRWLKQSLASQEIMGLRFLPALLHASFPAGDLRGEPPGIENVWVRRSWGGLARYFDLPPPISRQRGKKLITAVFAIRATKGIEVYILPIPEIGGTEKHIVESRVATIESIFRVRHIAIRPIVLNRNQLDHATNPLLRLLPFGALLAGVLPEDFWPENSAQIVESKELPRLMQLVPSPCCALALLLLSGAKIPVPAEVLKQALESHWKSAELADPDLFCALWLSHATNNQMAQLLFHTLAIASQSSRTKALAASEIGERSDSAFSVDVARLVKLGRNLSLAGLSAVRNAPNEIKKSQRQWLHQEILSRGLPEVLLEHLGKIYKNSRKRKPGPLMQIRKIGRRTFESYDFSGACIGRGVSLEQAQVRAMSLLSLAIGESPASDDIVWRTLGERLSKPAEQRTLLLAVEPAATVGPPHDPMNRGPERAFGFSETLAVLLRPGGRPSAQRITPQQVVGRLIGEATRGTQIESLVTSGEAHPAAARLLRIAQLCKQNTRTAPLALEAGGEVYYLEAQKIRRFKLKRFAARPRLCSPDPEAPDLSPYAEENLGKCSFSGNRMTITCQVVRLRENYASILYVDPHGYQLHEEVPLALIDQHLSDAQSVLRSGTSPMLLAIRYASELDGVTSKYSFMGLDAKVSIKVQGEFPFGLQISCAGETFGAGQQLSWTAAAQAVLSSLPSGTQSIISAKEVSVTMDGRPVNGLMRLYARSVALRRLALHIRRAL